MFRMDTPPINFGYDNVASGVGAEVDDNDDMMAFDTSATEVGMTFSSLASTVVNFLSECWTLK